MDIKFVQAKHFRKIDGKRKIDLIVLHSMESPEKGKTAENVAAYFARGTVKASAHYNVDADSIVQGVKENDVAFAAPGANNNGIQIEHAGYARQTRDQWLDDYGRKMLKLSAELVAELCHKHDIPVRFVDAAGLKLGRRGITTHRMVSLAFKQSSHTDPGKDFPLAAYLGMVTGFYAGDTTVEKQAVKPPTTPPKVLEDMKLSDKIRLPAHYQSTAATNGTNELTVEAALRLALEWSHIAAFGKKETTP